MKLIALLCPPIIAVVIKEKRSAGKERKWHALLAEYGLFTLFCNVITMSLITYGLRISDVEESALSSFPFFTKYVMIDCIVALVLPYICEVWNRYVSIKFVIEDKKDNEENN